MSINNIQLKDLVVSQLYKDHLLATDHTAIEHVPAEHVATEHPTAATAAVPPTQKTSPTPSGYKTLGNNLRNITIVVHSPGIAFLPDDQLNVLTRMLEACRMNIGDVAIVNHAASPVVIGPLKQQLKPSFVLLFGPTPQTIGLPMDFPVFKIQAYDQCTYLTAPSLEELVRPGDESKLLKSKLWVCLKTLFGI